MGLAGPQPDDQGQEYFLAFPVGRLAVDTSQPIDSRHTQPLGSSALVAKEDRYRNATTDSGCRGLRSSGEVVTSRSFQAAVPIHRGSS